MTTVRMRSIFTFVMLITSVESAWAHAILLKSSPAANAVVTETAPRVSLTFNSKIDGKRSRLTLTGPGAAEQPVELEAQSSPDTLTGVARVSQSGEYHLRWQVLAVDGHITRGEITFRVRLQ